MIIASTRSQIWKLLRPHQESHLIGPYGKQLFFLHVLACQRVFIISVWKKCAVHTILYTSPKFRPMWWYDVVWACSCHLHAWVLRYVYLMSFLRLIRTTMIMLPIISECYFFLHFCAWCSVLFITHWELMLRNLFGVSSLHLSKCWHVLYF